MARSEDSIETVQHPWDIHERLERALLIIQLTETAEHPISLAQAWWNVTGDRELPADEAMEKAVYDKIWFRRKFGTGMVAAMDAYGFGLLDFMRRLKTHLDAPKRDAKGRVIRDPDTKEAVPDYAVQFRAFKLYDKMLHVSGLAGIIEPPAEPREPPGTGGEGEAAAARRFRDELRNREQPQIADAG